MTSTATLRHSAVMDRAELALCVDVLGPLLLRVEGRVVDVPGTRRRALLALLALAGNRGVSTDRLVDALWPDGPPDNAVQALYSHVSRLRGHLGPLAERLTRYASGYRLRLEPFELDVDAARRLAASDPAAALALWRGAALEEFRSLPWLEVESVALDELRLQLVDDQLEDRLARGDRSAAAAAASAATDSPLRERTVLLHVRALARDGRTAEAMEAAQAFRRRLVEETGLDPTTALAELEQLVAAGLVERAPTVRRVAKPDSPMVGRQHDREEVLRLLAGHAVVTLTGPGGVGKTRLALDIAAAYEDLEAVLVPLSVVDRAERVFQAVASTLGLRTVGDVGPADLAAALADRALLLVLDNCEHVVVACRELVIAVRLAAAQNRILATSRVTLQVPDEYVVRLQPLPVPRDATDLVALRRQPGVRAFVEHARRRRPDYEVTADDAADLVEVLRRLDGLPLGIELAARQVAVMPLRDVRRRLGRALDLATGRQGPEDERQRTLRASIDWSYRLLEPDEQCLLRAIAPFVGGVDLSTVEALAAESQSDPINLLHRLVDASLLVADPASGRYRVLFIVRAFLADELERLEESDQAQSRFVERCQVIAEEIGAQMQGPEEAVVDRRLRAELANLRAARDLGDFDARAAITVAVNEVATWRDLREIWTWAAELADDPRLVDHPLRGAVIAGAAEAARLMGNLDQAEHYAREAIELAADEASVNRAWSVLAVVAHFRGDFATAGEAWLRAAEASENTSAFVGSAALSAAYAGNPVRARELLDRATALVTCGSHRAFVAYVEGELLVTSDPAAALPHYSEAIAEAARVGCSFIEGVARVSSASARTRSGDLVRAAEEFAYLIESWRRTGQVTQLWTTARNAAELLASVGNTETAALLLICADSVPGAAAVGPEIARFSARAYLPLEDLVDETKLRELRTSANALGAKTVLDRALVELRNLSA